MQIDSHSEVSFRIDVFEVVPTVNETWLVVADGRMVGGTDQKEQAVAAARIMALRNQPSRLVVRSQTGEIESVTPYVDETCRPPRAVSSGRPPDAGLQA